MSTRSHWFTFVFSMGIDHKTATTCRSCKGICYLYSFMNLPKRWNPECSMSFLDRKEWLIPKVDKKFKRTMDKKRSK